MGRELFQASWPGRVIPSGECARQQRELLVFVYSVLLSEDNAREFGAELFNFGEEGFVAALLFAACGMSYCALRTTLDW